MTFKKGNLPWNKNKKCPSITNGMKKFYLTEKGKNKKSQQSRQMKGENNITKRLDVKEKMINSHHWTKNGKWSKVEIKEKLGRHKKGKTLEQLYGKEKAINIKDKIKKNKIEHNKKYGTYKHTKETKQKLREYAYKRKPKYSNTKPELLMQKILDENNITYETQKQIYGVPDIFIEPNICVFVDGEYYHNYPFGRDIDKNVNKRLKQEGYKVIRFWSEQIKNKPKLCINKIKRL
jgi:DNA mismatch endonuclease (patch repair protein)